MVVMFDRFGKTLGPIDFVELQWNRKYLECGQFVLYVPASEYTEAMKYVQNNDRPETGIVQKVVCEEKTEGKFATLSGFFIESALDGGCYKFAYDFAQSNAASREKILAYLKLAMGNSLTAAPYKQNIKDYVLNSASVYPSSITNNIEAGLTAGTALHKVLSDSNMSFVCYPRHGTDETKPLLGLDIKLFKGVDRKDDVFFGEAYNNVSNIKYTYDESNVRSKYTILQELPEDAVISEWTATGATISSQRVSGNLKYYLESSYFDSGNAPKSLGAMYPEKVLFTAMDDIEIIPANKDKILNQMVLQAKLDMLNNYKVENIEVIVLQERFLYREHYDLGDICTVRDEDLKIMFTARIIEIREVHKNNMVEIEVVLGTPQKQKWKVM